MLLHALFTEPDDKALHGKLRLCEGHVSGIEGVAHHSAAELNDAVQEFQEAQRLLPQSPDPPLGLMRVYLNLGDVDKAAAAFHQAETSGFQLGNRERAKLADAYRDRANRTWWDAGTIRGMPQEKDQIQQAADDYQRALDLYQKSAGFGSSTARIKEVQASLESVNTRLQQIAKGQEPPDPVAQKRGRVFGAIVGLFRALRDKSTKKDGSDH
jgi:tetratricopeptide (TPR) repeat protein